MEKALEAPELFNEERGELRESFKKYICNCKSIIVNCRIKLQLNKLGEKIKIVELGIAKLNYKVSNFKTETIVNVKLNLKPEL